MSKAASRRDWPLWAKWAAHATNHDVAPRRLWRIAALEAAQEAGAAGYMSTAHTALHAHEYEGASSKYMRDTQRLHETLPCQASLVGAQWHRISIP